MRIKKQVYYGVDEKSGSRDAGGTKRQQTSV